MEATQWDVTTVKDWLMEYREKERDIDTQIERLERFITKMTSVGAQTLSDMPRATGSMGDRIGGQLAQKEELESSIRVAVEEQSKKRKTIESILTRLRHPDEKAVIRIRYIDRENWSAVTELMFGNRGDYGMRVDSYQRRVFKAHGNALQNMAEVMNGDPNMPAPAER